MCWLLRGSWWTRTRTSKLQQWVGRTLLKRVEWYDNTGPLGHGQCVRVTDLPLTAGSGDGVLFSHIKYWSLGQLPVLVGFMTELSRVVSVTCCDVLVCRLPGVVEPCEWLFILVLKTRTCRLVLCFSLGPMKWVVFKWAGYKHKLQAINCGVK